MDVTYLGCDRGNMVHFSQEAAHAGYGGWGHAASVRVPVQIMSFVGVSETVGFSSMCIKCTSTSKQP